MEYNRKENHFVEKKMFRQTMAYLFMLVGEVLILICAFFIRNHI
jgi:hypothetical protein